MRASPRSSLFPYTTVFRSAVSGSNLYAGGGFTNAGGVSANHISKWNGSAWSALGLGMDNPVNALAVSGSDPYAGRNFETPGRPHVQCRVQLGEKARLSLGP